MARGPIKAFIKSFNNTNIFICFYHFISRIILHLPQLRSKKNPIRNNAINILIIIKYYVLLKIKQFKIFIIKFIIKLTNFNNRIINKFFNYFYKTLYKQKLDYKEILEIFILL